MLVQSLRSVDITQKLQQWLYSSSSHLQPFIKLARWFIVHWVRRYETDAFNDLAYYVFNWPNFWLSNRVPRVYSPLGTLLHPDSRKLWGIQVFTDGMFVFICTWPTVWNGTSWYKTWSHAYCECSTQGKCQMQVRTEKMWSLCMCTLRNSLGQTQLLATFFCHFKQWERKCVNHESDGGINYKWLCGNWSSFAMTV